MVCGFAPDLDLERHTAEEAAGQLEDERVAARRERRGELSDPAVRVGRAACDHVSLAFEGDGDACGRTAGRRVQHVGGKGRHERPVSYARDADAPDHRGPVHLPGAS